MKPAESPFQFLLFDVSDDGSGVVTLEAMVSVRPERLGAVQEEWRQIIDWAQGSFPDQQGPLDDGHLWDTSVCEDKGDDGWTTLTLTLTGQPAFMEALDARFGLLG